MKCIFFSLVLSIGAINFSLSQEKVSGPIINEYGKVFKVANPDYKVDTSLEFKAVFDIANSPDEEEKLNHYIETGARFLNMHAQVGIPKDQLHVALVIHGSAAKDVLTDTAYEKRYGTKNPNTELIKTLIDAGVNVILCGQSASFRGIEKDEMIRGVQLSLSAMTALIQLQNEDYRLIKF
tara:strand:- start:76284 stop:76823 length:540 start_codon:yes stop_codon:yes gene_type:complete